MVFIYIFTKCTFGQDFQHSKKVNNVKMQKKEGETLLLKKSTLQDENKINDKNNSNLKFRTSKSGNFDEVISNKNRKDKDHSKNNQINNTHKINNIVNIPIF